MKVLKKEVFTLCQVYFMDKSFQLNYYCHYSWRDARERMWLLCLANLCRGRCAPGTCADSGGPIRRCTWRRSEELAGLDTAAWWGCSWRCRHQQAPPGTGARLQTGRAVLRLGHLKKKKKKKHTRKWTVQRESNRMTEQRGISGVRNNGTEQNKK